LLSFAPRAHLEQPVEAREPQFANTSADAIGTRHDFLDVRTVYALDISTRFARPSCVLLQT
jgi:hypothetical protein